jgi:hypothetical protein
MDVFARRALERPDVEANRAGCNPREHGSCLAGGADWSSDGHDASPLVQAGALQNSQSPVDTEGDGDAARVEPLKFDRCSILLIFEKLMYWSGAKQTRRLPMKPRGNC